MANYIEERLLFGIDNDVPKYCIRLNDSGVHIEDADFNSIDSAYSSCIFISDEDIPAVIEFLKKQVKNGSI